MLPYLRIISRLMLFLILLIDPSLFLIKFVQKINILWFYLIFIFLFSFLNCLDIISSHVHVQCTTEFPSQNSLTNWQLNQLLHRLCAVSMALGIPQTYSGIMWTFALNAYPRIWGQSQLIKFCFVYLRSFISLSFGCTAF